MVLSKKHTIFSVEFKIQKLKKIMVARFKKSEVVESKNPFYVINMSFGSSKEVYAYDVIPYFLRMYYSEHLSERPITQEEFVEFVRKWGINRYWARCEYEHLILSWPPSDKEQAIKVDIWDQILMNIDLVAMQLQREIADHSDAFDRQLYPKSQFKKLITNLSGGRVEMNKIYKTKVGNINSRSFYICHPDPKKFENLTYNLTKLFDDLQVDQVAEDCYRIRVEYPAGTSWMKRECKLMELATKNDSNAS